ncbi:MAG: hypothetical protein ACLQBX_08890 [Candidatus Limnocylindrales bacterium]
MSPRQVGGLPSPAFGDTTGYGDADASDSHAADMRWGIAIGVPVLLVVLTALIDAVAVPIVLNGGQWFNAGRPDFFLMADAFLHGRLWLAVDWGSPLNDIIVLGGHVYVPFAPFPAFLFMPLVALIGVGRAIVDEPLINALLAGVDVALAWAMLGAFGVRRWEGRGWLTVLFGFGTVLWNITERGGVWHTAEIVAMGLTFWALIETRREQPRPWLLGLLGGAAFLTRSTLLFALPYYAWVVAGRPTDLTGLRRAVRAGFIPVLTVALASVPFGLVFFWYNWARFGSPLETGYELATLPPFLEALRAQGLFSIVHLPMNLDYLFLKGPDALSTTAPFFVPSTLGMSVLLTSPALLVGLWSLLRSSEARVIALTGLLVLVPTLLYYGGGWVQFGYRYLLDSVPLWLALCAIWASRRGVGWIWQLGITWSVLVNLGLVYWSFRLS